MDRRILVITHHFPPSTVAASFRPLRLAKYLPRMGHRVWVLSATEGCFAADGRADRELVKEIPSSVHVTRLPNPNPLIWYEAHRRNGSAAADTAAPGQRPNLKSSISNLKSLLVELAKFPDVDASWAAASLLPALYLVVRNRIELIYTSGPPFGAHVLGLALKRLTHRPWIAHYGNPWTANPSISWRFSTFRRRCEGLDRAIVHSADSILVLDEILADCIHDLGRTDGVHIHPNGFDPEHFAPTDFPAGRFTITYAGSLYNVHNPQIIYNALSIAGRRNPAARADMRVVFAGPAESDPLRAGAPPDIEFTGPLGHSELIGRLNDSHVLLDFLTAPSDRKFTVSCKLYEYMAAKRPILAVTPEGPMAREVRRLNLGKVAPCDDPAAVADAILGFYGSHKSGVLRVPDDAGIERYSAPNLVREFAEIADQVCGAAMVERSGAVGRLK